MLRDEAFHFTRIGTFLERADNTARMLDRASARPRPGADATAVPDPYEWSVLLRALSAFEVYRRVYRDVITPYQVAQMLILRDDMPRSLLRCCKEVYHNLRSVANEQSQETERRAGELHAMLHFTPHGGHHRGGPAALSRAIPGAPARSRRSHRVGLPRPSGGGLNACSCTFDTKRSTATSGRSSTASQSLHLTPRRDPWQRAITWNILRPGTPPRAGRCPRQHLAPADHRGAASRDSHRGARGGRNGGHRQPSGRWTAVAARLSSHPPRSPRRPTRSRHSRGALRATSVSRDARADALAEAVYRAVRYKPGTSDVKDTAAAALSSGEGVCQDHAHVYIACRRAVGMPARYVSGYLYTGDTERGREPRLGRRVARRPTSGGRAWTSPTSGRRFAATAASPSAATTSTPRRCAACARAAAARPWKRRCWWPSRPYSTNSRLEFRAHDLLRRPAGRHRSRVAVRLSDQRRRRSDQHVPQDGNLSSARTIACWCCCRPATSPSPRRWSTSCTRAPEGER